MDTVLHSLKTKHPESGEEIDLLWIIAKEVGGLEAKRGRPSEVPAEVMRRFIQLSQEDGLGKAKAIETIARENKCSKKTVERWLKTEQKYDAWIAQGGSEAAASEYLQQMREGYRRKGLSEEEYRDELAEMAELAREEHERRREIQPSEKI